MATRRDILQWMATGSVTAAVPLIIGVDEVEAGQQKPSLDAGKPLVQQYSIRRSGDRGTADYGWLKAKHSFSFASYRDPKHMGFRSLRVMNEDVIQGGRGFPMHPHWDMEIITYILDGSLQHRDSLGNGSIIKPGEIQKMSAGSGIRHSEFNPASDKPVHLLQIWMTPNKRGIKPGYQQQIIPQVSSPNPVRLIASPTGEQGSVSIQQDARVYACQMSYGQQMQFESKPHRHIWIQVARGSVTINKQVLNQGDGFNSSSVGWIKATANQARTELLLFDLS